MQGTMKTTKIKNLLQKTPDSEDQDAFETMKRVIKYSTPYSEKWLNAIIIRYHCKPLSYYFDKYKIV